MNNLIKISFFLVFSLLIVNNISAQEDPKQKQTEKKKIEVKAEKNKVKGFVDEDGDGYNDNAPDHDGDGIPNGLDPDYKQGDRKKGFVDLDGDGINDNAAFGRKKGSDSPETHSVPLNDGEDPNKVLAKLDFLSGVRRR